MFNPEEESQFNIKNAQNETTTQENYYNYSNSMTPYAYPRKRYKEEDGCFRSLVSIKSYSYKILNLNQIVYIRKI